MGVGLGCVCREIVHFIGQDFYDSGGLHTATIIVWSAVAGSGATEWWREPMYGLPMRAAIRLSIT